MSDVSLPAMDFARRAEARLDVMFRKEELASLSFLAWLRTGTLAVVALWLISLARGPNLAEHLISCVLFVVLGWVYLALTLRSGPGTASSFP